jgi:hypothetical protein
MVLCAMDFAEEMLGLEDLFVLVHEGPPFTGYDRSLKGFIKKWGTRKLMTPQERYNHERDKHLYRVFEEILGFKLMRQNEFICYIIRLWKE